MGRQTDQAADEDGCRGEWTLQYLKKVRLKGQV